MRVSVGVWSQNYCGVLAICEFTSASPFPGLRSGEIEGTRGLKLQSPYNEQVNTSACVAWVLGSDGIPSGKDREPISILLWRVRFEASLKS